MDTNPKVEQALEYRQLGQTSLRVSMVGFGAGPLGDIYGRIDSTAQVEDTVRYAIDQGINFFDVSPYYGLTLAESRLGEALQGHRQKVVLATKCGRYGFDEFDFSAATITAGVDDSLRRLRTDYVDLLQAHDVEFGDINEVVEETVPAMRELQRQGKARTIGITGYSLANLRKIAERVKVDSILTYCRYNLMVDDMDDTLMPFAREHRIGIINAAALHMGILTEGGPPAWHPAPAEVRETGRRVAEFCREHGVDVADLALCFCFRHPNVASTLVGMASRRQVDASLQALKACHEDGLMQQVRALIAPVANRTWPSGREENYG